MGGISFCRFESLSLLLPFLYFFILIPRDATHLRYEKSLSFSLLFLAGSLDTWEGHALSSVSCVPFCLFLLNCLNLFLTVFTRLGDPEPFGNLWGSQLSFLLQSSDMGFFSFSFFFSHKLLGLPFFFLMFFWASSLLGLPFLLFSVAPCAYFFGLRYCDFLDLNNRSIHLSTKVKKIFCSSQV